MAPSRFLAPLLLLAAGAAAHIQLSLSHPRRDDAATLRRRQLSIESEMQSPHEFGFYPYAINISVGTPPQEQQLVLTLGSMDSFVLDAETVCPESDRDDQNLIAWYDQCRSGAYDQTKSRTRGYSGGGLDGTFAGESVMGEMITERVRIGYAEVDYVEIGLARYTRLLTGFFGLSYTREIWGRTNVIDSFLSNGRIQTYAFSLWAGGDDERSAGSLLFGAVDRSKYNGTLKRVQASKFWREYMTPGWAVNVSSILVSNDTEALVNNSTDSLTYRNFYATISPTTILTNLPLNVATPIWELTHATLSNDSTWHLVNCNATLPGAISLEVGGLGGYRLNATLQDLVVPSHIWSREEEGEAGEMERMCMFGIQSDPNRTYIFNHASSEPWVIGNNFLKDTYMVFDGGNMEVSMAPLADDMNGEPDIVEFEEYNARAPGSEFVGYKECFEVYCDDDDNGYYRDDYNTDRGDSSSSGMPSSTKGVIIGSVVGGVGLITACVAVWFFLRWRRARKARAEARAAADALPKESDRESDRDFDNHKFLYDGAPQRQPAHMPAVPRKPVPTYQNQPAQTAEYEEEPIEMRRRMSVEPKSILDITPAGTVSPMSTPRDADARSLREGPEASGSRQSP